MKSTSKPDVNREAVVEAERSVIAAALSDTGVYHDSGLDENNFLVPQHGMIWRVVAEAAKNDAGKLDPITLWDSVSEDVRENIGGYAKLADMMSVVYPKEVLTQHVERIRDSFIERSLGQFVAKLGVLRKQGYSGMEQLEVISKQLQLLESHCGHTFPDGHTAVQDEITSIEQDIANGFQDDYGLDPGLGLGALVPGGVPTDKVTCLFAESGTFKTTVRDSWIDSFSRKAPVLNFSLEDSPELTRQFALSRRSGIPIESIVNRTLSQSEIIELKKTAAAYKGELENIITVGDFSPTMEEIIRIARQYKRIYGAKAVFIDYIQLLSGRGEERLMLAEAMKMAQVAARRDRMAYIFLSQVADYKLRDREYKVPMLNDMFGSGALAQGCKLAIAIYRPWKYDPVPQEGSAYYDLYHGRPDGPQLYEGIAELWIRKNRLGAVDRHVKIAVNLPTGAVRPLGMI